MRHFGTLPPFAIPDPDVLAQLVDILAQTNDDSRTDKDVLAHETGVLDPILSCH